MTTESPLFTVGPPPHWRSRVSITQMNFAFILALLPAAVIGAFFQSAGAAGYPAFAAGAGDLAEWSRRVLNELGVEGWMLQAGGSFGILAVGAGTGLIAEYLIQLIFRQPYHAVNGHGVLMGLLLAMLMPPNVPWWVVMIGVIAAILIGKQIYGGIGGYPFHPAMVGWLILLLSWGYRLQLVDHNSIAAVNPAVIYFTALGGVALVALGHVRYEVPFGVIAGAVLAWLVFNAVYQGNPEYGPKVGSLADVFTASHLILAAFFIAPDPTSSPSNPGARWAFALGIGALYMLIRVFGQWQDPVPFAVILMNLLSPLLDRLKKKPLPAVMQNG